MVSNNLFALIPNSDSLKMNIGCALSKCDIYDTPIGSITIDREVTQELYDTGEFEWFSMSKDEEEHRYNSFPTSNY